MDAVRRLKVQPWMSAAETRAVLAALTARGSVVRFVGGCVRDAVLGRPVKDIDIATPDPPETVMPLLQAGGVRAIPTGLDHGTVTAVAGDRHIEITTLRRDVETFGRRARVAFIDDWEADARRRDFTINALFLAPDGDLFDPTGGLEDLEAGRVRFVGEAATRIEEDLLRILRFFRFHAFYGREPPDEAALEACRAKAAGLITLSVERVCGELLRLLAAPAPADVMRLMAENGVLAPILPEATRFERLERLAALEEEGQGPEPERRLAAVLAVDAAGAAAVAERLRLSNAQGERLALLTEPPVAVTAAMDARAARRALYHLGDERFRDLVLLAWAAAGEGEGEEDAWRRLAAAAEDWRRPELPVAGADVLALGIAAGPEVGRLLSALEAWWIAGDFQAGREEALERLAAAVERAGPEESAP